MSDLEPMTSDPQLSIRTSGKSFLELLNEDSYHIVPGQSLERNKDSLLGVPFFVTKIVYRNGVVRKTAKGNVPTNYVSLELVTADVNTMKEYIKRQRITDAAGNPLREPLVRPDEALVINDGSTGVCRQATELLHTSGVINVGNVTDDNYAGPLGESIFDTFHGQWVSGSDKAEDGFEVRLLCPRGLRVSTYENDFTKEGVTYYFG